jgi:5-oxopent-3-ene-1,2,5-tricarboxylate decarboxylase/2-hydroxyhepta-2,4-diene-1,7-dioate isomerase
MRTGRIFVNGRALAVTVTPDGLRDDTGTLHHPERVRYLPPVTPRTVLGLALNYADHAAELAMQKPSTPALFLKPLGALVGHREPVVYPRGATYCHYETELAVVVGRTARRVRVGEAWDYIAGYTVANDFTCRDFVTNVFRPPVKAKGFDTFGPLGPFLVTPDEVGDPARLTLRTYVNGDLRQEGTTEDLIVSIPEIIAYVTAFMTLQAGDVILTGTPRGISPVYPGDVMRSEVEGVGVLENPVVADAPDDSPAL